MTYAASNISERIIRRRLLHVLQNWLKLTVLATSVSCGARTEIASNGDDAGYRCRPTSGERWSQLSAPTIWLDDSSISALVGANLIVAASWDASQTWHTGAVYDTAADTWAMLPELGAPSPRRWAVGSVVGTALVVWGGAVADVPLSDGSKYDVSAGSWTPISPPPYPLEANQFSAFAVRQGMCASSGADFYVWGGTSAHDNAGILNVPADTWRAIPSSGAPSPRKWHQIIWTGSELIVWGGLSGTQPMND